MGNLTESKIQKIVPWQFFAPNSSELPPPEGGGLLGINIKRKNQAR